MHKDVVRSDRNDAYAHDRRVGAARVLVTTRVGGTSLPPYDAANLALHVGDDESAVRRNRARLAEQIGVRHVQFMHQVHGRDVAVVGSAVDDDVADVDALITTTPGACIAVLVADCVPVIITGERSVAVVHSGRPGVAADVVGATVDRIREHDAGPLQAFLGPAVCGRCYEVPADMRAE
ncbi:MAG TPA: polyphenol oxidase family protein, partial [Jatrophihabitans sp.]|nr:polyphenol oxidase family protein [Jatrophihabitans sp.]